MSQAPRDEMPSIAILGPTCSWKTDLAINLALHLQGEVISCDSMQVYRGLDVGTAKPSPETRTRVPHHLIDILDISERFDASSFMAHAREAEKGIRGRGHVPILAGGTGLYARAFVYGLQMLPARRSLSSQLETQFSSATGPQELRRELLNWAHADRSEVPNDALVNPRRLLRAVEVLRLTGAPPWKHHTKSKELGYACRQIVILPGNGVMRQRFGARTKEMLENGWIEETRTLVGNGLLASPTARQALGYAEIAEFLRLGRGNSLSALCERIVSRTMKFARRQKTWFKHQHPGAKTLNIEDPQTTVRTLTTAILETLSV